MAHVKSWKHSFNNVLCVMVCLMLLIGICGTGLTAYAQEEHAYVTSLYYALYSLNMVTYHTTSTSEVAAILDMVDVPYQICSISENVEQLAFGQGIYIVHEMHADDSNDWFLVLECESCQRTYLTLRLNPLYTDRSLMIGDIAFSTYYLEDNIDNIPEDEFYSLVKYAPCTCLAKSRFDCIIENVLFMTQYSLGTTYDEILQHIEDMFITRPSKQNNGSALECLVYEDSLCSIRIVMKFNNNFELCAMLLGIMPPVDNSKLSLPLGIDPSWNVDIEVGLYLSMYIQ